MLTENDWYRVEQIRERAFHSSRSCVLSLDEQTLLSRAIKEDKVRYNKIGQQIREDYAITLKML